MRDATVSYPRVVRDGSDIARSFRAICGDATREHFLAVYMDARNRPIGMHVVSIGSVDATIVHPREVFLPAVHLSACKLVVAHNHPSGDPQPSTDDRLLTDRLRDAGALLGIDLLDHIVIGADRYYSFATEGTFAFVAD